MSYFIYDLFRNNFGKQLLCRKFVMACHQKLAQYTLFCLCTYVIKFLQNNEHETFKNFISLILLIRQRESILKIAVNYIAYICCLMQARSTT